MSGSNNIPRTLILKNVKDGAAIIEEIQGFPYGVPQLGTVVNTRHGVAICSSIQRSSSSPNSDVFQASFTLK